MIEKPENCLLYMAFLRVVRKGDEVLSTWRMVISCRNLALSTIFGKKKERLLKAARRRRNRREVEHPNDYKRRKHEESLKD